MRPELPGDCDCRGPFVRLVRAVHPLSRVVSVRSLPGGVSAQVYAVQVEHSPEQAATGLAAAERVATLVVRLHGEKDLARDQQIARHEFMLLQTLWAAGLPVPRPLYVGAAGEFFPTPCLVTGFIEGEAVLLPPVPDGYVRSLAEVLARIHAVDPLGLGFLPHMSLGGPAPERLLHGDFWPGNVLCRDGRVAGVLDWEDAAVGDPLADVANARLELLWAFGAPAMEEFTRHYLVAAGLSEAHIVSRLPLWDMHVVLKKRQAMAGWGLAQDRLDQMRQQGERFLAEAVARAGRRQA